MKGNKKEERNMKAWAAKAGVARRALLAAALLLLAAAAPAQVRIDWQQCYGTEEDDHCEGVVPHGDGFRVAGSLIFPDGTFCHCDAVPGGTTWTFDINAGLSIQRQNCYPFVLGQCSGLAASLACDSQGGTFLAGLARHDLVNPNAGRSLVVYRLDESLQWADWYADLGTDSPLPRVVPRAIAMREGGVAAAAAVEEASGDVTAHFGGLDCWVARIDGIGGLLWERTLGTAGDETPRCLALADDGGLLVGLRSNPSGDGNIGCGLDGDTGVLAKLDGNGVVQWTRCFPGFDPADILALDDGFLLAGSTVVVGSADCALLRCDSGGGVLWTGSYGGSGDDSPLRAFRDGPDGFTVFANAASTDGDLQSAALLGNPQDERGNIWVFHVDDQGSLVWERCIGSSLGLLEQVNSVERTGDGGFLLGADMTWFSGEASGDVHCTNSALIPYSGLNLWVLHLSDVFDYTATAEQQDDAVNILPNPANGQVAVTAEGIRQVELRNLLGQKVASFDGNGSGSLTIGLSDLAKGVYLVTVRNKEGECATKKLIVE